MSVPQPALAGERPMQPPWYVHDRYADLLSLAEKLAAAEAWAGVARGAVKVADPEQVEGHESSYPLPTAPAQSGYHTRDYQPRIMRDRVTALGRSPKATPRHPQRQDSWSSPRAQRP